MNPCPATYSILLTPANCSETMKEWNWSTWKPPVCGPAYADLDTRRGVPAHQLRGPAEMPDVRVAASPGHLRCAERACCHADCWNAEPLMRPLRSSRATKFEIKALACCRACERGESCQARRGA